jgi:hypothetical protein
MYPYGRVIVQFSLVECQTYLQTDSVGHNLQPHSAGLSRIHQIILKCSNENIMKKLFLLLSVATFSLTVNAQDTLANINRTYARANHATDKTFMWSLGIQPSIPIGNFHEYSGFGFGGSLQGEYKPGRIGITLNAGYIDYFGKSADSFNYPDFKYIPVLAGVKYYMSPNSFLHAQAGPGFGTNDLGTSFWYGAGIGFNLGKSADIELKYTGWHQNEIEASSYSDEGNDDGGDTPSPAPAPAPGGNPYGGHYSTIDLRLAVKF